MLTIEFWHAVGFRPDMIEQGGFETAAAVIEKYHNSSFEVLGTFSITIWF